MSPSVFASRTPSPFRPESKSMSSESMNIIRAMTILLALFILLLPLSMNVGPSSNSYLAMEPKMETQSTITGNIIQYRLPDTNQPIATGTVSGYTGFAYVVEAASTLYFVDLFNDVTLDIALPTGNKLSGNGLTGYDVDLDGSTEFFLRNYVNLKYYLLMVDLNNGIVSEYEMPFPYPTVKGFGLFNGDTYPDLVIQNTNNRDNFLTLDVHSNTTIGTFLTDYTYGVAVGHFTSLTTDAIAVYNTAGTTGQRNITVVEADGTQVISTIVSTSIEDMVVFKHGSGLDEIITIDYIGYARVYDGLALGVIYSQLVDTITGSNKFIATGDFNLDSQEDFVVVSRYSEAAFFRNGTDGSAIHQAPNVYLFNSKAVVVGQVDIDSIDDVVVGTTLGALGTISGADGNYTHLVDLIDIQMSPGGHQILSIDVNSDNREDIFCRINEDVYLVLSDIVAPNIIQLPIDPLHPTILDDYITISVEIDEISDVEHVYLWIKEPGSSSWIQPQDEMFKSHSEGRYFAFVGDLIPGEYEYFFGAQDIYQNYGQLGNETDPLRFSVSGDFVWQSDYSATDYVYKSVHQSDVGNLSDGSSVIYTIERQNGQDNITLNQYSQYGENLSSISIAPPKYLDNFAVFTAMLDGDNVLDVIVLEYYYSGTSILIHHGYSGVDLSLIDEGTCPFPYKDFEFMQVYDDNQDGYEELYLVSATNPQSILKLDNHLVWSQVELSHSYDWAYTPRSFGFAKSPISGQSYMGVIRGAQQIDIYNTVTLALVQSLPINWPGNTKIESIVLDSKYNATSGREEFVAGINYWQGVDSTVRIFVFEGTTTDLNATPIYEIPHESIAYLDSFDAQGDASDELFILLASGELILAAPSTTLSPLWVTTVTSADPLSSTFADFDGDTEDEFVLFTDQDELLTSVSFNGQVEWTTRVGEMYNPLVIGNIDSIPGVEIGGYPFASTNSMILGVVRNLDTHYVLDVHTTYSASVIEQGETFKANVTVENCYGELISDASIYMTAHYINPEGPAENTFGFYFDWPSSLYHAETDATWPMGPVDLSLSVGHDFYHTYLRDFPDAVTVLSDLHVSVQAPDLINQGEDMTVEVLVQDNVGRPVRDATVSVTFGGVGQSATQSGPYYVATVPELDIEAGNHNVSAAATHLYGTGVGMDEKIVTTQILTSDLIVSTNFPVITEQNEPVMAWFNITDPYGNEITGAMVSLRSGVKGFPLIESSSNPGCYTFNHNITLGLGNQTFELHVDKEFLYGPYVTEIEFDVLGDLKPNVFYDTRVEGGSTFDIHVFVRDQYGPIFSTGTLVSININGTIYSQSNADGSPDYNFLVPADFLLGPNNFTVSISTTYANFWIRNNFTIRAYSDAAASATVFPEGDWIVVQGERTTFEMVLRDYLDRPVQGASVTIYVKALSYRLMEIAPGLYRTNITTVGWAPGEYQYTAAITHEDIQTSEPIQGNITILGVLELFVFYNPSTPTQGAPLWITITVIDAYGNPVPGLEVLVTTLNMPTAMAEETDQVGTYMVFFEFLPDSEGYGYKNVTIQVAGESVQPKELTHQFYLDVAAPDIGVMTIDTLSSFAAISFLISLIGMFLYFRLAPTMRRTGSTIEELKKSVKRMDRLYILIVLASAAGLIGSMWFYSIGEYGGALILTVVLLGTSVLLYGLWLYRDAVSAVMIRGSLNRKRMIAGLWHLFFVPVVIILILTYGTEIDWFKAYMIDDAFVFGDISIPVIMTTIFTAYLSSILVVVVNLYREVSTGLKKLQKMEKANTPKSIMEDERETMVNRYSSSIRIKFLMFLVVVGAAAVTTMDFLQSYQLGVIVLMPVTFLVVIPFISSKIVKVINKAGSAARRRSGPSVEPGLSEEEAELDSDIETESDSSLD